MDIRVPYVDGSSDATSECQVHDLSGVYGRRARVHVLRHKHIDKSAGYELVEMGSGEQALRAVLALEGALFEGNCLRLYVTLYVSTNL
jgi:hypothetical protein